MVTQSGSWPATEDELNDAIDLLVGKCMAAHGQRFTGGLNHAVDNNDESLIVNMANRRAQGYGLSGGGSGSGTPATPQDAYVASLPPAARQRYLQVLFGSEADRIVVDIPGGSQADYPANGCQASAIRALAGDISRWGLITYVPQELGNRLADEVPTTSDYQAALARWQTCMAASKLRYRNPEEAVQALRAEYKSKGATPAVRSKEITTAVADGSCALQAHLPLAALTARRALAERLGESDRRNLVELAAARAVAVARAADVLGRR